MGARATLLRQRILENAAKFEQEHPESKADTLVLSYPLLMILVGKHKARSIKDGDVIIYDMKNSMHRNNYVFLVDCADENLGPYFSYVGDENHLEEFTVEYMLLQS